MKRITSMKKALGFLTAAMMSAALAAGCSNGKNSNTQADTNDQSVQTEPLSEKAEERSPGEASSAKSVALSESELFSDRDLDPSYDEITAEITLSGDSISVDGAGAEVSGSTVTITGEGVYRISGTLSDGQVIVDTDKKVQLVLDNADITCSDSAPVYIMNADKTFITLAANSVNTLTDGGSYAESEDGPDAALFSADSLTINGTGALTVNGNCADGIHSKDDIVITGGTITVKAAADGIKGKDYVAVADGNITVDSGEDGIKSSNSEDESLGFIYIAGGSFSVTSGSDAFQAETVFEANGGDFDLISGGGSVNAAAHTDSFGGMGGSGDGFGDGSDFSGGRPGGMDGGRGRNDFDGSEDFTLPDDFDPSQFGGMTPPDGSDFGNMTPPNGFGDSEDFTLPDDFDPSQFGGMTPPNGSDFNNMTPPGGFGTTTETSDDDTASTKGIKAGVSLNISGGTFKIDSADDTLHSNGTLDISGGELTLNAGDDGLHADGTITVSAGSVTVVSSYEGVEGAQIYVTGGTLNVTASDDGFNASDGTSQGGMGVYSGGTELSISGGSVYVNANGDGIDSNGDLFISGGTVIVDGPLNDGNGALDSNGSLTVTGGVLVAAGSSGMAESPDADSTQNCVSAALGSTFDAETLVTLLSSDGSELLSYAPSKGFSHVVISTPDILTGETYTLCTGGTASAPGSQGELSSGYGGDGSEAGSFTADDTVSYIGTQGFGGPGGGFGGMNGGKRNASVN